MNCCAISIPTKNPAQAAETSRQAAFLAPIFSERNRPSRENHIGRCGSDEQKLDVLGRDLRLFQRLKCGLRGHITGHFVLSRNATLLDPGARGNPFVAGIDHVREVLVGQDLVRRVTAGPDD
jgi:hypothetical protein